MFKQIFQRKVIIGIVLILVVVAGYLGYRNLVKDKDIVRYATASVKRDTLVVSVSGTGQVLAPDEVDIKSKVSGDVVYVGVKNGQEVKEGDLIILLDTQDAQRAVREAELNLESAKLSLEKLKLEKSRQLNTLETNYEEGIDILAKFYDDFPIILNNLKNIYFGTDLSISPNHVCDADYYLLNDCNITYYVTHCNDEALTSIPNQITKLYHKVNDLYDQVKVDYQTVKRSEDNEKRLAAIKQGHNLAVKMTEMVKIGRDIIRLFRDTYLKDGTVFNRQAIVDKHTSDLATYFDSVTTYANKLLAVINSINNCVDSIKGLSLDLKMQELTIKQRENALVDAKRNLADYYIRAPFDGVVADVNVKKGEYISPNRIVATLITNQKIAEVTLNEVDIPGVKVGQKANITFDAIEDLKVTGKVIEIDTLGTESQGVVTYDVKIAFDTQDERIKPGMTLTADIITKVKQDALVIPNSAIKYQGDTAYVQVVDNTNTKTNLITTSSSDTILPGSSLRIQRIKIGLTNDTMAEVLEGLKEGDVIVIQVITPNFSQKQLQRDKRFQPGLMRQIIR